MKLKHRFVLPILAMVLVALVSLPERGYAGGKPSPIYKGTSLFSYFLMTPQTGMNGEKTNFWVKEAGVTFTPFSFAFGPKDTVKTHDGRTSVSSTGNISFTLMGLYGVTRCEGIPMAETDFWKVAITPTITYGNYSLSLGARWIQAKSFDVSFPAGPRTITILGETLNDRDFGVRGEWNLPRSDSGFFRSIRFDVTHFNADKAIRNGYYVYASSVSVQDGWGFDIKTETKTGNFSFGAKKEFGWSRGTYALEVGAGYEFGANSIYVYAGGKIGPLIIASAYQTEPGLKSPEKSYHFIMALDLPGFYSLMTGGR